MWADLNNSPETTPYFDLRYLRVSRFGMLIGYAHVSTQDQNLDLQIDALTGFNCGLSAA